MSKPLEALATLRWEASRRAQRALLAAQAELSRCEGARTERERLLARAEAQRQAARDDFARALTSAALTCSAERLRGAELDARRAASALSRADETREHAREVVRMRERALLDAARNERAIEHLVERREALTARRLALRAEEEREDAHRARSELRKSC